MSPTISEQALAGLRANDSSGLIKARLEQERQLEDMKRRAALEATTPGFTSGATPFDIQSAEESLAESPSFGVEPQRQLARFRQAQQGAQLQGFSSPQELYGYERQQEERKLGMPLEIAREQQRGAMDIARERGQQAAALTEAKSTGQMEALQRFLGPGGLQPGQHVSIPGVGAVSMPKAQQAIAPALVNQISEARRKAESAWGWGKDAAQAKLQSLLAGAIANHPAPDTDKAIAQQLMSNPTSASMPIAEVVSRMERKGTLQPEQIANIRELLMIMRGEQ